MWYIFLPKILCQASPFINSEVIDPDHAKWLIIQSQAVQDYEYDLTMLKLFDDYTI
jgi:hypothetical protein